MKIKTSLPVSYFGYFFIHFLNLFIVGIVGAFGFRIVDDNFYYPNTNDLVLSEYPGCFPPKRSFGVFYRAKKYSDGKDVRVYFD